MNSAPLSLDGLNLDPITLEWLKVRAAANLAPVQDTPVAALRGGFEMAQAQFPDMPRALCDDIGIPDGAGGKIGVRLIRPPSIPGKLPAAVYLHGGGWVVGSLDTHARLAREIAAGSGVALVAVRYARAPEARYPVALEQAYAVTAWLAEYGEVLGLDSARLAVAGDSSGANLAAAVALLAKRRNGPALRQQTLIYPVADASCSLPSYFEFESGLNLTRKAMQWYWDQYAPDAASKAQDTASLVNASIADLQGLPPALVITAEYDVLRDEGEAYANMLAQAGVAVTAKRYPGAIHGFMGNNALARTANAQAGVAQVCAALREAMA